jgi:outer membrane autotransporter protein
MFTQNIKQSIRVQHTFAFFLLVTVHFCPEPVWAACDGINPGSNTMVACSGVNSNVLVNAQTGSSNVTLAVQQGASLTAAHTSAVPLAILSVEASSTVENQGSLGLTNSGGSGTNRGAAMLAHEDGNQLFNREGASIVNSGRYNDGMAANGSNNMLLNEGYIETNGPNAYGMTAAWGQTNLGASSNELINSGEIVTRGSNARAISILGESNQVINEGMVTTSGNNSTAIYMQGDDNQLINSGHIEATGSGSSAVFSNTVASTFNARIENQFGGQIISHQAMGVRTLNGSTTLINAGLIRGATNAIEFGNGDDILILQTGSVIDGIADGGSGTNELFLQGNGAASNSFVDFQSLTMQGEHWIWQGSGAFDQVSVTSGQLQLAGPMTGGNNSVSAGAVLSGEGTLVGNLLNQGTLQPGIGQSGGQLSIQGNYHSDQGALLIHSTLGDDSSSTSRLVVDGGVADGITQIQVINLNGQGAQTVANGILLIQAVNGASTEPDAFHLSGRLVAGAYEYDLYRGGFDGIASDNNWYLRSISIPIPPNPGTMGLAQKPALRPETGVYLRNLTLGSTMFVHTLHDRSGEARYNNANQEESNASTLWIRIAGNHTDGQWGDGQIDLGTDTSLIHFGGDLIHWSNNGTDRMQIGLMGAYGRSEVDASAKRLYTNNGIKRTANGKVDGYGVGAYATWYGDQDSQVGPYADLWALYGWYDNKVEGNRLGEEKYGSHGWVLSMEAGYALVINENEGRQWIIEPQAQLVYTSYSVDDHREVNGTWVSNGDEGSMIARAGARFYSCNKLNENAIQPFVEANWWYSDQQNSLLFNGVALSDDTPKNTYELKVGLQGEIADGWQVWGHIGGRWGENSYRSYEGMVGVKRLF